MKLSRRVFAALAALTFTFLLTACQPGAEQTAPSPDPVSSPVQDAPPSQSDPAAPVLVPENDGNGSRSLADIDRVLSLYEIGAIDEWLNTGTCAVLHSAPFDDPDDIDLAIVLHDGIDVYYGQPKMILTGADQEDLAEVGVDLDKELGNMVGIKLTGAQINNYLERILGITLTDEELQQRVVEQSRVNGWEEWFYVPKTDTYYHFSNGTTYIVTFCVEANLRTDGTLSVVYQNQWNEGERWRLELEELDQGYRFLSAERLEPPEPLSRITRRLSEEELADVTAWLKSGIAGLLWSAPFENPDKVDVALAIHDGTDTVGLTRDLTDEDWRLLAQSGMDTRGYVGEYADGVPTGVKITGAQINDYLERTLGITLTDEELQQRVVEQSKINGWHEWHYVPETDTYYHFSNGTASVSLKEISGSCREDGTFTVECCGEWPRNYWSIELEPTGDGYHILSAWTRSIGY